MVAGSVCALLIWFLAVPPLGRTPQLPTPRNAVWLGREWLRGSMAATDMQQEIGRIAGLNIRTLFVHAGPFEPDGSIPSYDPGRIRMIKEAAQSVSAEIRVLAWLGGLNAAGGGDMDLINQSVRSNACLTAQRLVAEGFDGVQLNIEPTPSGDEGFIRLLSDVRKALPDGAFLSVATNLWGPWWVPNRMLFSDTYLRQVTRLVDQIAVMNYDSYAVTGPLFRRISAAQTKAALRAVYDANPTASVLIGVPAYPTEGGLRHWSRVESPTNALAGIDAGLAAVAPGARLRFEGVAMYAGWTAGDNDWEAVGQWHHP